MDFGKLHLSYSIYVILEFRRNPQRTRLVSLVTMARERDFEMVEQPVQYSVTYNLSFSGVWGQSKPVSTFYNTGAWRRILVGVCHHDNSWVSHPSLAKLWAVKTVK